MKDSRCRQPSRSDPSQPTSATGAAAPKRTVGSLCIAHLGHLHHTLTQQQLDDIGHVDVLLLPVDGGYTLDLDGMIEVIHAIKAPLMVPMHYFSTFTPRRFLDRVSHAYGIEFAETPSFVVSKATLPSTGKFMVVPGH